MPPEPWFKPLVWTDYRLAVLFTVIIPLILLIWAFVQKSDPILRLLIIYWRVASLLAVTVYLMIAAIPISFITGLMARILIPTSLWFWVDLNEEIDDQPQSPLKLTLTSWRWAVTVYNALGTIFLIPFVRCAGYGKKDLIANQFCSVWLEPPWAYKEYFHANTSEDFLGFLGIVGLLIYVAYLSFFMLRLSKQGRSATGQ